VFEGAIAALVLFYLLLLAMPGIAWQFVLGSLAASLGLIGGGAAGLIYHLALHKALLRLKGHTRGWLWSPVSRHADLDEIGRRAVLPWFRLGAAGFVLCLAGIGLLAVAVLRAWLAG
jgi:hypothetical protein